MAKNAFATIGILAVLLLSLGLVSAATFTITDLDYPTSVQEDGTLTFTYNVTYIGSSQNMDIDFTDSISNIGTLSTQNATGLNGSVKESVILTGTVSALDGLGGQTLTVTLNGSTTGRSQDNISFDVSVTEAPTPEPEEPEKTLCESESYSEIGDLEISDFDVNNNGEGKDDEWQYLDEIEIIVEIENTHNTEDVEDVEVRIVILDNKIENGGIDITNDFDFDDEVLDGIGRLKDGDKEEVTFFIDELPSDIDDGTYYIYIMAYEDGNEDEQCESKSTRIDKNEYYFQFSIESVDYDESVIAKEEIFRTSIDTYCGQQNLEITIPIYNLGDDKEEKVLVKIFNSEMGIDEYRIINNLKDGDKEEVTFFIDIPSELSKEKYNLGVSVHFDWDEDKDEDNQFSYDEQTLGTSIRLNIESCRGPEPTISASLESEAKVGEELVIIATIINNGKDDSFDISISGYESWAELVSISPQSLSLDEDEEGTVVITLIPSKEGFQTFDIDATADGESYDQAVSVNIAEEEKGLFADINKTVLYTVAGIAALIILIFLTLIVKVSRKSKKVPQF